MMIRPNCSGSSSGFTKLKTLTRRLPAVQVPLRLAFALGDYKSASTVDANRVRQLQRTLTMFSARSADGQARIRTASHPATSLGSTLDGPTYSADGRKIFAAVRCSRM